MRVTRTLLVIAAAAMPGAVLPAEAQEASVVQMSGCPGSYVIGPEDVLELAVWGSPEMTRTVPVRPDGKISLPLLNDIQAAGYTPMQLRDALMKALVTYMPEPSVSVLVREIHSFKVTVIGQVRTPGRYELKDRATVVDVIAMAGGFNEYADRDKVVVLRQEQSALSQIPFAYDKLTSKNPPKNSSPNGVQPNVCVRPGDVVVVP
jgi:polysaccharide biosynthesis/export protein